MATDKFERFLEAVLGKSKDHGLRWEEMTNENEFQVLFDHGTLIITQSDDWNDDGTTIPSASAILLNEEGRVVDEIVARRESEFELVNSIFKLARSQARRSDSVLDELMNELK